MLTLGYQINVGLRLLNFEPFSQAYALIRYPTFINFPTHAVQGYGHRAYLCHIICMYNIFSVDRRCEWKSQLPKKYFKTQKEAAYSMILSIDIETFWIFFFVYFMGYVLFSIFLVLVQKIQVPRLRLLIFIKILKATFISYPTFINFDRNSQDYVYLIL